MCSATPDRDLDLPPGRVDGAPPGGQADVPPGLPEGARESTGPPAEHLDPDVGEELPGGDRRPGLGSPEECRDGHAQAGRQAGRQRLEGDAGRRALGGRGGGGAEDGRDEIPAPQDPRIGLDGGAGAARGCDRLPPPRLRTKPPPWSSGRRPCGRPSATKAR